MKKPFLLLALVILFGCQKENSTIPNNRIVHRTMSIAPTITYTISKVHGLPHYRQVNLSWTSPQVDYYEYWRNDELWLCLSDTCHHIADRIHHNTDSMKYKIVSVLGTLKEADSIYITKH